VPGGSARAATEHDSLGSGAICTWSLPAISGALTEMKVCEAGNGLWLTQLTHIDVH